MVGRLEEQSRRARPGCRSGATREARARPCGRGVPALGRRGACVLDGCRRAPAGAGDRARDHRRRGRFGRPLLRVCGCQGGARADSSRRRRRRLLARASARRRRQLRRDGAAAPAARPIGRRARRRADATVGRGSTRPAAWRRAAAVLHPGAADRAAGAARAAAAPRCRGVGGCGRVGWCGLARGRGRGCARHCDSRCQLGRPLRPLRQRRGAEPQVAVCSRGAATARRQGAGRPAGALHSAGERGAETDCSWLCRRKFGGAARRGSGVGVRGRRISRAVAQDQRRAAVLRAAGPRRRASRWRCSGGGAERGLECQPRRG
mmetsp:Transcript_25731/g.82856  ORF Transcript_25731/g.82856 Transcript_25731/m.82856 type:complete len:320 (+) Transcript_25731:764-1723(+)